MIAEPLTSPRFDVADGTLADEHARGDSTAFAELYRRYYLRLVRLCERRLGDPHLAEDAAQETLLRALRYLGRYDTSRPIWPWLRAIALRIAHENAQRSATERSVDLHAEELDARIDAEPFDVDQWVVLRTALEAVPPRQRTALLVRYVDDWSTADSARLYGLGVTAFEQLLWRARRRLSREYLRLV